MTHFPLLPTRPTRRRGIRRRGPHVKLKIDETDNGYVVTRVTVAERKQDNNQTARDKVEKLVFTELPEVLGFVHDSYRGN